MAKNPRSLIALPVHWTVAQSITWDDGGGPYTTPFLSANTWTRLFLAPSTGGTSEDAPTDLLRLLSGVLPSTWSFTLATSGRVRIAFLDAGFGSMTLAGTPLGNALGFTSNISGLSFPNYQDGDTMPGHCWFPYALSGDTGWRSSPSQLVAAKQSDGRVVAWDEGVQLVERVLRADYAPASETVRTSRGLYATPYWPPESAPSRWSSPSIVPESCPAAWTVHETLSCAPGLRVAYVLGNLQDLIAGSTSAYQVGYFDPESLQAADQRAVLSIPNYSSLVSVPTVRLTQLKLATQETR